MLEDIDRRIVGALQVNGRASWRRIAEVLGEPERTVSRRGTILLESGVVVVSGWRTPGPAAIVSVKTTPQMITIAANALARRSDTTFAYMLAGPVDCVTEVKIGSAGLSALLFEDLPGTPGMIGMTTSPVSKYYRTGFEWQPDLITSEQADALREFKPPAQSPDEVSGPFSNADRSLFQLLASDGRMPHDELGRRSGISEATARRRIDSLRRSGALTIRAVVEPSELGLPVEAVLWIKAAPTDVDEIGRMLLRHSGVRYAAAILGEHQLVADVIMPSRTALHDFVTRSPALAAAKAVDTTLVVTALKRSGVLATSHSPRTALQD